MILIAAFLLVTKQTLSTTTTWQFFRDWNSPTKLNSIERSSSSREVDDEGDWMEAAVAGRMLPPRLASVQKGMPHCWLLMLPNMINRGVSAAAGDTNQRSFSVSSVIFLYYFRLYCVGSFGLVFCSVLFLLDLLAHQTHGAARNCSRNLGGLGRLPCYARWFALLLPIIRVSLSLAIYRPISE